MFCTYEEKNIVEEYMKQCNIINNNMIIKDKDNNSKTKQKELLKTPQQYKEHTYCHLCKQKYKEYFLHTQTLTHFKK